MNIFKIVLLVICLISNQALPSQSVGIGTNTPHTSALVDMNTNNKGMLPPRLTTLQRKAIVDPAAGLLVFDIDKSCLFLFDGAEWQPMIFSSQNNIPPIPRGANDGSNEDEFGRSVSISGDYAIIGAPQDGAKGSAYIFLRNGSNWTQQAKLTASNGLYDDGFGLSVSISGNYAVVGAWGKDVFNVTNRYNQGAAYVFVRNGTTWTQQQILYASDGTTDDHFGQAVAIDGTLILISSMFDDVGLNDNQGSVYVFSYSGNNWIEQAHLFASDGAEGDKFGFAVAISSSMVIIGAPEDDIDQEIDQGSAYIFSYNGNNWSQSQKITAFDGMLNDRFGYSVSINNVHAVIGAIGDDYNPNDEIGSVYIFGYNNNTWSYLAKLIDLDGKPLGYSVALSGDYIITGSPYTTFTNGAIDHIVGTVFIFKKNGSYWHCIKKITIKEEFHILSGASVAISGLNMLFGGYAYNNYTGKVFFYNLE
jgi:hypothetical protein